MATPLQTGSLAAASAPAVINFTKNPLDSGATFFVYGTYTGLSFSFQGSLDGTNFFPIKAEEYDIQGAAVGTLSPANSASVGWRMCTEGLLTVQANVTALSTGTINWQWESGSFLTSSPIGQVQAASGMQSNPILTNSQGGIGYGQGLGAGGTVTQTTSRVTGVTLNKATGQITLVSAAGSATPFSFTLTNSSIGVNDTVVANIKSSTDTYSVVVTAVAAGSCRFTVTDLTSTSTEQPVISFAVVKASAT